MTEHSGSLTGKRRAYKKQTVAYSAKKAGQATVFNPLIFCLPNSSSAIILSGG